MTRKARNLFPVKSRRATPSILDRGAAGSVPAAAGGVVLDQETIGHIRSWLIAQIDGLGPLPLSRDDLVGEVLLRLLGKAKKEDIRYPLAYASTILKNLVRDEIRDLERFRTALEALGPRRPVEYPGNNAHFEDEQLVRHLLERARLSPMEEKVIQMQYFGGMRECDVARELSLNPGTICNHRARALKKLARQAEALRLEP